MNSQNKTKKIACISTVVGLSSLFGVAMSASSSIANPIVETAIETAIETTIASADNSETLRQGIPTRRLGGGTRDNTSVFAQNYTYLAALVMPDGMSVTTAQRPTLLFHVPELKADQTAEFVLRDSNDELVYENTFEIDQAGGIIDISLSGVEALPALTLNSDYQWYFSIIPEPSDRSTDIVVHGGVRRIESSDWLWHDAAVEANAQRQENPADSAIASEWEQLIETAGLSAVVDATEPAVQIGLN